MAKLERRAFLYVLVAGTQGFWNYITIKAIKHTVKEFLRSLPEK